MAKYEIIDLPKKHWWLKRTRVDGTYYVNRLYARLFIRKYNAYYKTNLVLVAV